MKLESKTIRLRLVEESDAEFILSLRTDNRYNNFLSKVSSDLQAQKDWIRSYKKDEEEKVQFYFIIERLDGTPCGTVRIYDLRAESFCWGSWILNQDKTVYAAVESAFLVYEFGFNELEFKKSHFDVMKKNKGVVSFHEKLGAVKIGEDQDNFYFEITQSSVEQAKKKWSNKIK